MSRHLHILPSSPAAQTTRTHCPYCAFQCGMTLTTGLSEEDGSAAATEVKADPDFPVNRGQMCIKGFTAAALIDQPARVQTPLMRDESGTLRPVSWEQALDFVAERMLAIRAAHGAEALSAFGSGALTNEKTYLLGKFVRVVLGSSQIDYNGRYCMASAAAGQNRVFGVDRGMPFPVEDIGLTRALLLWGSNCADTMPPIMQYVHRQREHGKLIVVDPRRTDTARQAHLHLQLVPGSDLALANGMMFLALELKLIDQQYIAARTVGFDALRREILTYEPARVERITGVSSDAMREAVKIMAAAPSSMCLSGRGPEQQIKGSDTVAALANLMLALGKVGKPYSGYGTLTGQGNGQGGREQGQKADQLPGYRHLDNLEDRAHIAKIWNVEPDSLPPKGKSAYELLDSIGTPSGPRSMIVFGSNVVVASPKAGSVLAKVAALELLVVCDAFINETAELAHVVLPITQWAEEEGTTTNLEGRVIHRRQAMEPPAGVRSDLDIICELARRMGHEERFRYASTEAVFDELRRATAGGRADYSGMTYARLDEHNGMFWPCPDETHEGTPRLFRERFYFPDGKARMSVVPYRPAGELPSAEYPLFFTTGRYKEHYNSGAQTRRVDKLVEARSEPRLQIHPRLAERLGIAQDSQVLVESRRGRVVFRASLSIDIRPDTLFAPFHWGGRLAANLLTNPALDPQSRMPEFKVCAVKARRIDASSELIELFSPASASELDGHAAS